MRKIAELEGQEELAAWIKKNIDDSVSYLMAQSLFDSVMVEAKPVWVYPFGVLIGMARGQEMTGQTIWFINDGVHKDHLSGGEVSTPRGGEALCIEMADRCIPWRGRRRGTG